MSRTLISIMTLAVLVVALAGCGQGGVSQTGETTGGSSQPPASFLRPAMLEVPAGTDLDLRLQTALSSGTSGVGDDFTATVVDDVVVENRVAIPSGSTVYGSVSGVRAARRGAGNASLSLAFNRLELPDGYSTSISASMHQHSASKKKRNAGIIGGSAAGGALLGRIIGKDTKGAVVGAVVGGGIGTAVVASRPGEQVNLPAGATLSVNLGSSIKVPRG